jgi:hypothetical protein
MKNQFISNLLFAGFFVTLLFSSCKRKDFSNQKEIYEYSFEPPSEFLNLHHVKEVEGANSGKNVCWLDTNDEFSVEFYKKMSTFKGTNPKNVKIRAMVKYPETINKAAIVMSLEKDGKMLQYDLMDIMPIVTESGRWVEIVTSFPIKSNDPEANLKCYFWNSGKNKLMIDDFSVEMIYE